METHLGWQQSICLYKTCITIFIMKLRSEIIQWRNICKLILMYHIVIILSDIKMKYTKIHTFKIVLKSVNRNNG